MELADRARDCNGKKARSGSEKRRLSTDFTPRNVTQPTNPASYQHTPTAKWMLYLVLIASLAFGANYLVGGAYLNDVQTLGPELKSPPDSIYLYRIAEESPFKYRALFPALVKVTWHFFKTSEHDNNTFIIVYRTLSFTFYLSAVLTFFLLLRELGFNGKWLIAGSILYIILPAISFAFTYPVHTREDLLGFTLLHTGLIFLLRSKTFPFILISVMGALCRETLLILPFVFLFYTKGPILNRFIVAAVPVSCWIFLRAALGHEQYDVLGMGFFYNVDNIFQTVAFTIITFNGMWLLFLYVSIAGPSSTQTGLRILQRSALPVFGLVVASTFALGRITEIRLLYLLAPWIIPLTLYLLASRWTELQTLARTKSFLVLAISGFVGTVAVFCAAWLMFPWRFSMIDAHWWYWLALSCWLVFLAILTIPTLASSRTN